MDLLLYDLALIWYRMCWIYDSPIQLNSIGLKYFFSYMIVWNMIKEVLQINIILHRYNISLAENVSKSIKYNKVFNSSAK